MEITLYQFQHFFVVAFNLFTQICIVERLEVLDEPINHAGTEHTMLLEDLTLSLQAVGRSRTAIGQLCQSFQFVSILFLVNIDVDLGLLGNVKRIVQFKAMTAGHCQTSH